MTATPPDPEEPAGRFGDALPAPTKQLPLDAAAQSEDVIEVGARLPQGLYLGTASWAFPGWAGLVYGSGASESVLSRKGLAAYSRNRSRSSRSNRGNRGSSRSRSNRSSNRNTVIYSLFIILPTTRG